MAIAKLVNCVKISVKFAHLLVDFQPDGILSDFILSAVKQIQHIDQENFYSVSRLSILFPPQQFSMMFIRLELISS